jgi:hypothetical protein
MIPYFIILAGLVIFLGSWWEYEKGPIQNKKYFEDFFMNLGNVGFWLIFIGIMLLIF